MIDFSRKALITYITAGFPNMEFTEAVILKLQSLGVSAIEVGFPYTDPVADGPILAETSLKSLQKGTNLDLIFQSLEKIKGRITIPIYLMGYYSTVFTYGEGRFIQNCVKAGVTGSIIPDLSLDEGKAFFKKQKENSLDPVLLVFPNTESERIRLIASESGSFIYYVNLFGTTGVQNAIPETAYENIKKVREISQKPICAGFGVSSREDYAKLCQYANGVIIGSALVKRVRDNQNDNKKALEEVENFIKGILG
jgi:tryptophan synthase alpha chain